MTMLEKELLEALKDIRRAVEDGDFDATFPSMIHRMADAAIAKAEGRA